MPLRAGNVTTGPGSHFRAPGARFPGTRWYSARHRKAIRSRYGESDLSLTKKGSMQRFALLLGALFCAQPLSAQGCIVGGHVPSEATCVVSVYIDFLARMSYAETRAGEAFPDSADVTPRAFAAMKGRLAVEREALLSLRPLRAAKDSSARNAAVYTSKVIVILSAWDSSAQADYRRIIRFEMPLAQLEEKRAEQAQRADQSLKLLIAAGGSALDGTVVMRGGKAAMRRMTEADRDTLVATLERHFGSRMKVDSTGNWSSGWGAMASTLRDGLLQPGWQYLPSSTKP